MSRRETYLTLLLFVCVLIPLSYIQIMEWNYGSADNAFLDELLTNIRQTGKPTSQINASVYEVFDFIDQEPEIVLSGRLDGPDPPEINQFEKHAYFVLYLIAPLTFLIPGYILIPLLKTLCFCGVPLVAYLYMRGKRVARFSAALLVLLVAAHPIWSFGLFWQMYVDRFFLIFGLLFIYQLTREHPDKTKLLLTAGLCAILTERSGAICGAAIVAYVVLQPRKYLLSTPFYAVLAVVLMGASVFIIQVVLNNEDYQGFSSSLAPSVFYLNVTADAAFRNKLLTFLMVNLALFGLLGLFDWRSYLVTVGTMLPNIMGTLGGGEKTSFATHYHSTYFPFLVWSVATGYANVYRRLRQSSRPRLWIGLLNTSACVTMLIPMCIYPTEVGGLGFDSRNLKSIAWYRSFRELTRYLPGGQMHDFAREMQKAPALIPEGSVVSTVEKFLPILHDGRDVFLYPDGVDIADWVIVYLDRAPGASPRYLGAVSYLGPEAQKQLNLGLEKRLAGLGFDLENPERVVTWAVLKKREGSVP